MHQKVELAPKFSAPPRCRSVVPNDVIASTPRSADPFQDDRFVELRAESWKSLRKLQHDQEVHAKLAQTSILSSSVDRRLSPSVRAEHLRVR